MEQILAPKPGQRTAVCTGGRGAGPPEDCGGVRVFLEKTQSHHVLVCEHRDELAALLPLLGVDRFDRRTVNRALAGLAATGTKAA